MNGSTEKIEKNGKADAFMEGTLLGKRKEAQIKKEDDRNTENAIREISRMVAKATPAMAAAAIGAAIGSFVILKMEASERGATKWVPIPEWDMERITNAVTIIAEAMAEGKSWNETGFVMIQQRQPDTKALNTMFDRGLGKVVESVQINKNVTFSLADVGRKALASKRRAVGQIVNDEIAREEQVMIKGEVIRDIASEVGEPTPAAQSDTRRLMPTSW